MPNWSTAACLATLLALAACTPADPAAQPPPVASEVTPPVADAGPPAGTPPAAIGAAAAVVEPEFPTLRVDTVDGGRYDLEAARGRWVVVNFWATWCAPCLKEMPELSALDTLRDDVDVVGLAYDDIATAELVAFLAARPVSYPVAQMDVYAPPADFATPRGLPMTYLVAPDGRVAKKFLGPITAAEIEAAIAAAGGPGAAETGEGGKAIGTGAGSG